MKLDAGRWNALLDIEWRPRPYEYVFLSFAALSAVLILGFSPLPFSLQFAGVFILKLVWFVLLLYVASIPVILFRYASIKRSVGLKTPLSFEQILSIITPYWTLNYLMLSLRRTFSLLGTMYFFLHLKHIILLLNFTNHDLFLWNLDRLLHFGYQPNILLMSTFGANHDFSILLDFLYWIFFKYNPLVSFFFLMELKGRTLSDRYFFAYTTLWALGGLLYVLIPSDGPCYSILYKSNRFATIKKNDVYYPPVKHVFDFPVVKDAPPEYVKTYEESKIWSAKNLQDGLWHSRQQFIFGEALPFGFYGIAAMPSLHVGAAMMLAIFLYCTNPILGVLGWIYAALIACGSIFLQWHYAVDGYAGALLTLGVYWLSKRVVRDAAAQAPPAERPQETT